MTAGTLLALVTFMLAGHLVLCWTTAFRLRLSILEGLGLAILFGMGVVSLEMLLMSILGVQWTPIAFILLWPLGLVALVMTWRSRAVHFSSLSPSLPMVVALIAASAFFAGEYIGFRGKDVGWTSAPDAFAFYHFKANAFYKDKSLRPYYEAIRS